MHGDEVISCRILLSLFIRALQVLLVKMDKQDPLEILVVKENKAVSDQMYAYIYIEKLMHYSLCFLVCREIQALLALQDKMAMTAEM